MIIAVLQPAFEHYFHYTELNNHYNYRQLYKTAKERLFMKKVVKKAK